MAASIQSLAKYDVCSVIRFLNARGERPVEIFRWRNISLGEVRRREV